MYFNEFNFKKINSFFYGVLIGGAFMSLLKVKEGKNTVKEEERNKNNSPFVISWPGVRLSPPAPATKLLVYESLRPTLTVVQ